MSTNKLDVADLEVVSFATEPISGLTPILPTTTINDPTAATRCFICPPITYDCAIY